MTNLILVLGLFLIVVAVTMVVRALLTPSGPSSETLEQISAYGFAGSLPATVTAEPRPSFTTRVGDITTAIGRWIGSRFGRLRGRDYRARLISAGMYTTTPDRLLGTQFLAAVALLFLWLWLGAAGGAPSWLILVGAVGAAVLGWVLPTYVVDSRARKRREQVERSLPDLIDLIVVTLEAGLSFPQSLRLAASKIKEPLSSEVRLTLQEQNMGLTLVEALENLNTRVDTPGVRMLARSISQGETMGVSTGQIMRNLAIELRKRQRAYAEERAQKAPVKVLFPILLLIMPALFIVLLLPVMITIMDVLG
ncbi:MAG TPA: type II secretion system F family protein [Gaiella sp.]|jgi:tight adherence protein C